MLRTGPHRHRQVGSHRRPCRIDRRHHQHGDLAGHCLPVGVDRAVSDPVHPRDTECVVGQRVRAGDGDLTERILRLLQTSRSTTQSPSGSVPANGTATLIELPANARATTGAGAVGAALRDVSAEVTVIVTVLTACTGCSGSARPGHRRVAEADRSGRLVGRGKVADRVAGGDRPTGQRRRSASVSSSAVTGDPSWLVA